MEYPMCIQSLKQKEFLVQLAQKKSLYFNRKYRFFRLLFAFFIFKNIEISSGQGVSQIKPNLVWSIPWVPKVRNKKSFWYSLPRKKFVFRSEISTYSFILFSKIQKFHRSRSCSNRTIFGMEYPMGTQSAKQKEFSVQLAQEKSQFFIRNIAFISNRLRLLNFKNRPHLSAQKVIEIEPNWAWTIPYIPRM